MIHNGFMQVSTKDGTVTVDSNFLCNLTLNNQQKFVNINGSMNNLYFGYIEFNCSSNKDEEFTVSSFIISEVKCKECGFFCIYNNVIPQCRNIVFPLVSGLVAVVVPLLLLYTLFKRLIKRLDTRIIEWLKYMHQIRADKRASARARFCTKTLKVKCQINFTNKTNVSNKYKQKVIIKRLKKTIKHNEKLANFPGITDI